MQGRAVAVAGAAGPVALITVVGAVLRLWSFDRVSANPFYDAAVRSMSVAWHNFFFGAFEPGGQVSVEQGSADLRLQVASVKLFGLHGCRDATAGGGRRDRGDPAAL